MWDLASGKLLRSITDAHPPGTAILHIKVTSLFSFSDNFYHYVFMSVVKYTLYKQNSWKWTIFCLSSPTRCLPEWKTRDGLAWLAFSCKLYWCLIDTAEKEQIDVVLDKRLAAKTGSTLMEIHVKILKGLCTFCSVHQDFIAELGSRHQLWKHQSLHYV